MGQRALAVFSSPDPPTVHPHFSTIFLPCTMWCLSPGARTRTFIPEKCCLPLYSPLLQPQPVLSQCYYYQQYLGGSTATQLWVFETYTLPPLSSRLLQGQPGVSRPGPCPGDILISPRMENPQPALCQCSITLTLKNVSWCLKGVSCALVCAHCFWSCHWTSLKRVWFSLLNNLPSG